MRGNKYEHVMGRLSIQCGGVGQGREGSQLLQKNLLLEVLTPQFMSVRNYFSVINFNKLKWPITEIILSNKGKCLLHSFERLLLLWPPNSYKIPEYLPSSLPNQR